jgi:hypothetical protein
MLLPHPLASTTNRHLERHRRGEVKSMARPIELLRLLCSRRVPTSAAQTSPVSVCCWTAMLRTNGRLTIRKIAGPRAQKLTISASEGGR